MTHAAIHDPNTGPTTQTPDPTEKEERRDGIWVRREERAEMEKQRREGRERKELKLERKNRRGINYIYILTYCYSTILSLELYCSTIAKFFAIVGFTIV